jgi:glutamyl-tRNA synthetase
MRDLRNQEKSCTHSTKTPEETFADWKKMLAGDFKEGEIVLRLRGDMQSKNAVMRDPAIFTIRNDTHCIQGDDYFVWPLYDFAVAIEDHQCGITHVGRSAEFDTRIELQNKIRELLGLLPHPMIFHYARFNVIGSPASKRLIKPLVEAKKVEGWDDIRLVTIKGLRRRGIIPETIKELAKEVGMTTQPTNIDWSLLSAINRKLIDAEANRYFFIDEPVVLFVKNTPKEKKAELHYHPDEPELGVRKIQTTNYFLIPKSDYKTFKKGEEFRLKELYNVKLEKKNVDLLKQLKSATTKNSLDEKTKNFIKKFRTHAIATYTDTKLKPGPKIQWTVANPKATIPVEVKVPDVLFIDNEFNSDSLQTLTGIGEKAINDLKIGEIVQFERFGFVRVDSKKKGKVYVNLAHK